MSSYDNPLSHKAKSKQIIPRSSTESSRTLLTSTILPRQQLLNSKNIAVYSADPGNYATVVMLMKNQPIQLHHRYSCSTQHSPTSLAKRSILNTSYPMRCCVISRISCLHLRQFIPAGMTVNRHGGYIHNAVAVHVHGDIPIHLVVVEEKNEVGDGGSDPSVQASFSFVHLTRDSQYTELRSKCNCPTFLVAHAGPWLAVLGAVFTDKYIVQRLTDFIWIPARSALDDDQFLRIGRVLYALRKSVAQLRDWYDNVLECGEPPYDASRPTVHSRFYPTPNTYLRDEIPVQFKYEWPLERDASCATYLAKTQEDNPIDVVVKFATRYGEDVHKVMAEAGFAPKLLYYGKIDVVQGMPSYGGLRMVVMEYVDGTTACSSLRLPRSFHQELEDAIKYCHGKGFVFGDLRKPNIMITKDGKVQLIDFDWAGRKGEVKYPVSTSPAINWPKGAQGLGPILEEHDRDMLVRYCS
ncbi:hypothetical protein BDR06DRAFT_515094 [Suillus hirtellus]|nr:hypothetical protein BDR06DRAFT_515094 [Suillus hirtellus]